MIVANDDNTIVFVCDECSDDLQTDQIEFDAALAKAKAEGWTSVNKGTLWSHYCNACAWVTGVNHSNKHEWITREPQRG